jgi:hypothetical protein
LPDLVLVVLAFRDKKRFELSDLIYHFESFNLQQIVLEFYVLFCQPHKKEPKKVTATDKFVKIIVKHVFMRNTSRLDGTIVVLIIVCISRLSVAYGTYPHMFYLIFDTNLSDADS